MNLLYNAVKRPKSLIKKIAIIFIKYIIIHNIKTD